MLIKINQMLSQMRLEKLLSFIKMQISLLNHISTVIWLHRPPMIKLLLSVAINVSLYTLE